MGEDQFTMRAQRVNAAPTFSVTLPADPRRVLVIVSPTQTNITGTVAFKGITSGTLGDAGVSFFTNQGVELFYSRHGPLVGREMTVSGSGAAGQVSIVELLSLR